MREFIATRIDAAHAEIARLIELEKEYDRKMNPNRAPLLQSISECRIEMYAHSPQHRELMGMVVSATLPQQRPREDPCPGCPPGAVCRTPKCGRLKLKSAL